MYAAHAVAWRSSSSCTSSPPSTQEQTTSVGARSSFPAASGPAADFRRSSVPGPITRKRHGLVRLWLGAHRASSNSSSSTARSTGSGLNALCVRRVRIAVSTSIADTVSSEPLTHGRVTLILTLENASGHASRYYLHSRQVGLRGGVGGTRGSRPPARAPGL